MVAVSGYFQFVQKCWVDETFALLRCGERGGYRAAHQRRSGDLFSFVGV